MTDSSTTTETFDSHIASVSSRYRYWRLHLLANMYLGYAVFYFTRKNFNYALPAIVADLGIKTSDIGMLGTLFYFTYGISKFVCGIIGDRSNPRYFMGIGLIASGVINIFFGLSSSLFTMATLWLLNAFFQAWGWPSCAQLLNSWYSRNERGLWWSVWNTSHNIGGALIPILVGILVLHHNWRWAMIVPGIVAVLVGLYLCWRLRGRPKTLGLPSIGQWRQDQQELTHESLEPNLKQGTILSRYIFKNKYIWLLAGSYFTVYIVRVAINDWGSLYFVQQKGYSILEANTVLSFFEFGGIFGSLVAGWGSDHFFSGNRTPMNILFSLGIVVSVFSLWLLPYGGFETQAIGLFIVGFFVFGPQMLIGMAAAEYSHKLSPGAATGFIGLFGYLGAAIASYPISLIIEHWSWGSYFITLSMAAGFAGIFLLPILNNQHQT